MKPSHLGSELERTGFILRLGAEDQIREYDRKFGLAKTAYQDLISNLIVQEVSYDRAFLDAQNLFGDTTVRFAAVDGTEYSQFLFDLIIFFGGAYSLKGDLTFHSDRLPSLTYDQTVLQGGRGVSSCIPLYINEAVDLDQTILEIGDQDQLEMTKPLTDEMIIKNLTIADQIMSFSEIYLAYALASDPNESIKLLLLDRSLYTMHSSLLYDTSIRGLWKSCSLLGFEVDGEKIDLNDLGYGRHRLLHQTLRVPPFRGEYLRYSLIYLLEKSPLRRKELFAEIGAKSRQQQERAEKFIKKSLEEKYLVEEGQTLSANPFYTRTWQRLKKAVHHVAENLFHKTDKNPMKVERREKPTWLTTLDFKFLTLFSFNMLVEECWRRNILLLGVTKDTAARDFKNHAIPVLQNEGVWNFNVTQEDLKEIPNTDRMFLQSVSLKNHKSVRVPWALVEYDSAFTTIIPEHEKRRRGYVNGAIKNQISLEKTFLKSYIQLSQAKSDPQMRSNVLLIDRLVYPQYDLKEKTRHSFMNLYGGAEEEVETVIYPDNRVENPIQNIVLAALYAMSKGSVPEAFGHNIPLFMADKIAKHHYTEFKRIIDTTKFWITNNPDLRKFIFYMSTFRERRGEIESARRYPE